ncbi:MAG: hypothetical protein F9K49_07900 [Caedimonadaceae bacterium]|nr:MAG: hypothetical protein F9K49_07900 [Caedimonadaceae bacterium]
MFENFSKMQESYKKALEYIPKVKDEETKRSYLLHLGIDHAESLSNFGRLKEAIALCDNLKEIVKVTKNESQKPAFFGTSALIRLRYGQYEQCLKDLDSCFELISKEKNPQYLPFSMLIKAHCLLYLGDIKKAYQIIEECYPHLVDIFVTPECAALINAQLVKGACLAGFGKLEEAMELIQQSLGPYEKSTGFENDVLKGMGHRILGEIFEAKEDLAKAFKEYTKAENLYENILHEKTLDELGLLYTRLAILGAKLGDDRMVDKYLTLHIKNFGLSHPRTFEIKQYLDNYSLPLP